MKVISLTEEYINNIIKSILMEQEDMNPKGLKFGDGGKKHPDQVADVKALQQKLMDKGFLKLNPSVPTGYFGPLTRAALQLATGQKPTAQPTPKTDTTANATPNTTQKQYCQTITKDSDIQDLPQIIKYWYEQYPNVETYGLVNRMLNRYSDSYIKQGITKEIACQVSLIQIRPGYKDKNAIISDSINKLIYIFDTQGKFLGKSFMISGKNVQSTDAKKIAYSLLTWEEQAGKLGFKWVDGQGYVDTTGKNRKYNEELIYKNTEKNKTRFLPKGIFTTSSQLGSSSSYAGKESNMLSIMQNGKVLAQAIHGYYLEQPRKKVVEMARKVMGNPNDPSVNKEFLKLLSSGKINLSQSYGCLNVPEEFLNKLREYGKNAYLFNIGEDRSNYLVQNVPNYLNKTINAPACPSPQSVGAVAIA